MTSLDTRATAGDSLQRTLTDHGINEQGASAVAEAFDDLESVFEVPIEDIAAVDGVGPAAVEQVEALYPDRTAFDPRDLIDGDQITVDGYDVELSVIEIPDAIPTSQEERAIATAERLLSRVNRLADASECRPIGHHEEVRTSLKRWLDEHQGSAEDPGFWRESVFAIGPGERNRGELRAPDAETPRARLETQHQKAQTIHAWAASTFDSDAVTSQIAELEEEWRGAFRDAAAAVADERAGRAMRQSPPGEINGWEHITADSDAFALAYEGWSQGSTHVVVAAYRDSDGVFQVDEFAYPDWIVRDYDPQAGRENKRLRFDHPENDDEAATELRSHLQSWDGTPDHDPEEYPSDVNGWLFSYVNEDGLGKIEYVEPNEGESLTADYAEDPDEWWVQYHDPDNHTTDIECEQDVDGARQTILEAATRMMAVEGGGTLANHREVARNIHRVDNGEPATDLFSKF